MERLTIRNSDGTVSQPTTTTVEQVFYRLAEYEDAENDGRLYLAPCKLDDRIYMIVTKRPRINRPEFSFIKTTYLTENNFFRVIRDLGKTVFLTREEAEAAFERMKVDG